jgi:hypothetical protein
VDTTAKTVCLQPLLTVYRITAAADNHDLQMNVVLNGIEMAKHFVGGSSTVHYRISANSVVLDLNQNDRVWVKMISGGNMYSEGADQSFAGYKL